MQENLSFVEKSPRRAPPPPQTNGASRRAENVPPRPQSKIPPPGHRPSYSKEERERMSGRTRGPTGQLDIFADPPDTAKVRERRPRRNSDTSIISGEKTRKFLDPDDERRRLERRQREARRHGKSKPPSRRLDIIDKLDVTSIYGTGRKLIPSPIDLSSLLTTQVFHHDGPFDACNPARNRKGSRAAPMQAFPEDSRNMSLGGSGPNNTKLNLDQIHGTGHEAHIDYNRSGLENGLGYDQRRGNSERSASFNPLERVEPVHGEESVGLGTSTFLEGAPASRAAIQRRATEDEYSAEPLNGLSRKKSLAQKIRGVRPVPRMTSPEPGIKSPTTPLETGKSEANSNPFFKDYDQEYEKKGAQIASAEEKQGRARAPSSPRRGLGLERKITTESVDGGEDGKSGGGFLSRVKSLKGGPRRARTERREVSG